MIIKFAPFVQLVVRKYSVTGRRCVEGTFLDSQGKYKALLDSQCKYKALLAANV